MTAGPRLPAAVADRPRLGGSFAWSVAVISARTQLHEMVQNKSMLVLGAVQPAVFLTVALVPAEHTTAQDGTRVAFAVLLTALWGSTVWGAGGILRRERFQGTLGRVLSGVRSGLVVVAGKSLGATLYAAVVTVVTVIVVLAALRQPVALGNVGALVLGLLVVLFSGTALGVLVSALFVLTRFGPQLSSAIMYPVFLLGGMLIPLDLLPAPLRLLSALVSFRWVQQFFTAAVAGSTDWTALGIAFALSAVYAILAGTAFRKVVDRARRMGNLDVF